MKTLSMRVVTLSPQERLRLKTMLSKGTWSARVLLRARILLYAEKYPDKSNADVGRTLSCGRETVRRIRNRFLDHGLDKALKEQPRPGQPARITAQDKAFVIATACTKSPAGTNHWTVRLLAERFNGRKHKRVSREAIRIILQENSLKPWLKKNVVRA